MEKGGVGGRARARVRTLPPALPALPSCLVQQQDLGRAQERARDDQLLALPAGQGARAGVRRATAAADDGFVPSLKLRDETRGVRRQGGALDGGQGRAGGAVRDLERRKRVVWGVGFFLVQCPLFFKVLFSFPPSRTLSNTVPVNSTGSWDTIAI